MFFFEESLDELEAIVAPLFSKIEDKSVEAPTWPNHPYPPELRRRRAYCVPIKDTRTLTIDFAIPDFRKYYKSAVSINYVIGKHLEDSRIL